MTALPSADYAYKDPPSRKVHQTDLRLIYFRMCMYVSICEAIFLDIILKNLNLYSTSNLP